MGNTLPGIRLLGDRDCSYHLQLGQSASIRLTERKFLLSDGEFREKWEGFYTVAGVSSCRLALTKSGGIGKSWDGNQNRQKLYMSVHDDMCAGDGLHVLVQRAREPGLLEVRGPWFCGISGNFMTVKIRKTIVALEGLRETSLYLYENETCGGLVVLEWEKMRRDENPYRGTVAHYFAAMIRNVFRKIDIGLSVVAKIRVSDDGELDFTVEGPVQHPTAALFYMFDKVFTTGIWKPNSCPHCANYCSFFRKHCSSISSQSDSEDGDINFLAPGPISHPHLQNPGISSILGNSGVTYGNQNGNLIVNRLIVIRPTLRG